MGTPVPPSSRRSSARGSPVVSLVSLGCAKNTVDSERILAALVGAGFLVAEDPADADLCLVNTCGFIDAAREETAATLRDIARRRRRGRPRRIAAIGCLAERAAAVPAWRSFLAAADAVAGFDVYPNIAAFCRSLLDQPDAGCAAPAAAAEEFHRLPRLLTGFGHSAWLKVSEGCSHRCAFCSIPFIRGPHRSRPLNDIVNEATDLIRMGVRELCLVAQDTTAYSRDLPGGPGIDELVRALSALDGRVWFRLMYAHPRHLRSDLLDAMDADPRWCRYLDLPLQHASDAMLRRMGRGMGAEATERLLDDLRRRWPDLSLRTAFVVGHPGETEADFEELCRLVRRVPFAHVGVFAYSVEPGTAAERMEPRVPAAVVEERRARLLAIQREVSRARLATWVGRSTEVMVDVPSGPDAPVGSRWTARHRGQAPEVDGRVYLVGDVGCAAPGTFLRATVTASMDYDLVAKPAAPTVSERRPATGAIG